MQQETNELGKNTDKDLDIRREARMNAKPTEDKPNQGKKP